MASESFSMVCFSQAAQVKRRRPWFPSSFAVMSIHECSPDGSPEHLSVSARRTADFSCDRRWCLVGNRAHEASDVFAIRIFRGFGQLLVDVPL